MEKEDNKLKLIPKIEKYKLFIKHIWLKCMLNKWFRVLQK